MTNVVVSGGGSLVLPKIGQLVAYGKPFTGAVDTKWRTNIFWAGQFAHNPPFKYENRIQMQLHGGSVWFDVPLSQYPYTKPPQYFWSARTPQQYGWPNVSQPSSSTSTSTGSKTPATSTKKTTSGSNSSSSGTVQGPSGPLLTNPPIHAWSNGPARGQFVSKQDPRKRLGLISVSRNRLATKQTYKNWGFRFLYNPSTIQFSAAASTDVNPDNLSVSYTQLQIPGLTTFTLELYLNRIADLKSAGQNQKYYWPRWDTRELQQLWSRGTEYDLEYLYRTINGDPKNIRGWHTSANSGFLYWQRIDLRLANGLFITGAITQIDVTHVMMTEMMIPTFSRVNLTISQMIPDYS